MRYVVAGVDGTGSVAWIHETGGSATRRFIDRFDARGGRKLYSHGPSNELAGSDVEQIVHSVTQFVMNSYFDLTEGERAQGRSNTVKVFLVGHSRGGYAAIRVAAAIRHLARVDFLGLYDAVDRAFFSPSIETITNVDRTYHALRHPLIGSRSVFGNTGRSSDGRYVERRFFASHGGVGAAPTRRPVGGLADFSCSEDWEWEHPRPIGTNLIGGRADLCEASSRLAQEWVYGHAIKLQRQLDLAAPWASSAVL